jgi:DNA-binding CsgD family transcriptional regulator
MKATLADALSFIIHAKFFGNEADLTTEFEKFVRPFGVNIFSCTEIARPGQPASFQPLFGRLRPEWMNHYRLQDYGRIDPAVRSVLSQTKAFCWTDVDQGDDPSLKRLFGEAREFLGQEGIVVPIHGPRGHIHVVLLNGDKIDKSPETLPLIRMASVYFAEIGVELLEEAQDEPSASFLSSRQIECLSWAAEGKSDWEIGAIIGISENTVHRHIEKAKSILGVRTRMQAVIAAWRRRWLNIH